jgi:hypothetical protein
VKCTGVLYELVALVHVHMMTYEVVCLRVGFRR